MPSPRCPDWDCSHIMPRHESTYCNTCQRQCKPKTQRSYHRWTLEGKKCSQCGEMKSLAEYSPNSIERLRSNCKTCANIHAKKPDRKAYFKAWVRKQWDGLGSGAFIAKRQRAQKRYKERHYSKVRSRDKLKRAVDGGLIIKPGTCERCGQKAARIEGHHHKGYNFPLIVQWLCVPCHNAVHQEKEIHHEAHSSAHADRPRADL